MARRQPSAPQTNTRLAMQAAKAMARRLPSIVAEHDQDASVAGLVLAIRVRVEGREDDVILEIDLEGTADEQLALLVDTLERALAVARDHAAKLDRAQ